MSDAPQGEGWWQASDGRWYAPPMPPPTPPAPPPQAAPGQPAQGQPGAYLPPPAYAAPPPVVVKQDNTTKVLLGCLVALVAVPVIAVLCILAVTFLGRSASAKFSSVGSVVNDCPAGRTSC